MIEYFDANMHAFWFSVGFILLVLEAAVLGFSTGVVLFAGIGGLLTGAMLWGGMIPQTWIAGIAAFGISSGASALVLWKPLLRLQKSGPRQDDRSSDFIGYSFRLQQEISQTKPGVTQYSGIEWRVELALDAEVERLPAGTVVKVVSLEPGIFRVCTET